MGPAKPLSTVLNNRNSVAGVKHDSPQWVQFISCWSFLRQSIFAGFVTVLGLLLFVGCGTTTINGNSKPAISVTIPYGSHDSLRPFRPYSRHGNNFFVLLTNVSKKPVRVWQEWCSWGYYSLKFEAFGEDGKRHLIKRKPTSFYANFPDCVELPPGESVVWRVELDPSEWVDLSWLATNKVEHVKLRAIYSVDTDEESKRYDVWVGCSSSRMYDFILSQPSIPVK